MTLMKLAPEIVRLRRVAKAYAAGEFTRQEYRQARREVIENFQPDSIGDDDTQPRFATAAAGHEPLPDVAQSTGIPWLWLMAMVVAALVLVFVTAQVHATIRIAPVSERNPNPQTSPRINVTSVRIRDFQGYPGIEEEAVAAVIDSALWDVRSRNTQGDHGFTAAELEEVGRLLNALGVHQTDARLSAADAADLQALVQDQKNRRGVSVVELEEVAARVQAYYRDAGYFLAVAFVPAQQTTDGVVELAVLPGVLGDVVVTGGDADLVASRFADALGEPVTEDGIGRRLYRLNQLPGLKAQAAFEPGTETGETRLNLDVVEQRTWSARVLADNHGDDATGNERLTVLASWLNPRGAGDVLEFGLLQTVNPSNQTYGFVDYQTPMDGKHEIHARVATNSFTVNEGPATDGDGVLMDLSVERALSRSRSRSRTVELGIAQHRFSWPDAANQVATFASARLHSHRVWDDQRVAAGISASADVGGFSAGAFAGQDDMFWRLGVDAYAWKPLSIPFLGGQQKLATRLSAQLSESQLPSSKRLALGGWSRARGFARDTFLADVGVVVNLDLRMPLRLGELVLFADGAYGEGRNELVSSWGYLTNVGLGWDADLLPNLVSRVSLAFPVTTRGSADLDDDSPRFYWQLQYVH